MEKQDKFASLFKKMMDNNCSPEELDQLLEWINSEKTEKISGELILDQLAASVFPDEVDESVQQRLDKRLAQILSKKTNSVPLVSNSKIISLKLVRYAAAVLVIMLIGASYFLLKNGAEQQFAKIENKSPRYKNDIMPGGNKAILILADGNKIVLDSADNGTLVQQGNANVIKLDAGEIAYNKLDDSLGEKPGEIFYNMVATPRGGQYRIVLPDGSKVWLNAASSLHFPTAFTGKERKVELSGEGYFEIAKNAEMPFKVYVNNTTVEVLGTHFNVNAYDDETAMKTTLLEGSVKVSSNERSEILKPGEQLSMKNNVFGLTKEVNTEQVLAWKNGLFDFSNVELRSIARQLSRWYEVDISFEGNIPDRHISGIISRKNNISTVLGMLEFTAGIHSRIEGTKVIFYK